MWPTQALEGYVTGLDIRHLLRAIGRIFGGYYVIIPNGKRYLDLLICAAITLGSCILILLKLVKKPYPLAFYLISNSILLGFTYAKFMPISIRHFGNFYLVLIVTLWLAHHYPPTAIISRYLPKLERWQQLSAPWFKRMFGVVLLAHLVGGLFLFTMDLTVPYSASRAAAAYMRQANLQDEFIVASRDAQMASLSGYVNRKFYFPERQAIGSYTLFFKGTRNEVDQAEVVRQTRQLLNTHSKILLVLTKELEEPTPGLRIESIQAFTKAWQNEEYYLYWVTANG